MPDEILRRTEQILIGNDPGAESRKYIAELASVSDPEDLCVALQTIRNALLAVSAGVTPLRSCPGQDFDASAGPALSVIEERLNATLSREPLQPAGAPCEEPRRVMLLLGCLPNDTIRSSHLRLVCSYAAAIALRKEVEAVEIAISLETLIQRPDWQFFGLSPGHCRVIGLSPPTESWMPQWKSAVEQIAGMELGRKISVFAPVPIDGVYPYHASLREIGQFSPDVVIVFLGVLTTRRLPELLYRYYPQISIQFSKFNPQPPYCDLVLSVGDPCEFPKDRPPGMWYAQLAPILPLAKHSRLGRSAVHGSEEVLIVSALSDGRLERALTLSNGEFAQRAADFLANHPGAAWLFVGVDRPESLGSLGPAWRRLEDEKRVRYFGFANDLRAIYEHCDIYVHPPLVSGGGMGIAMAIAEGIPVLVEQNSEGAHFVAPELVYQDQENLMERLAALSALPEDRRGIAALQRSGLEARHSIAAASDYLYPLLRLARDRYIQRKDSSTYVRPL